MGSGGASVVVILIAFIIAKYTNRTIAGCSVFLLSCIGCVMMLAIPSANYGARYGGYVLTIQCKCWDTIPSDVLFADGETQSSRQLRTFHGCHDDSWCGRNHEEVCI